MHFGGLQKTDARLNNLAFRSPLLASNAKDSANPTQFRFIFLRITTVIANRFCVILNLIMPKNSDKKHLV